MKNQSSPGPSRPCLGLKAGALMLTATVALAVSATAQSTINNNNLIPNPGFDNGSTAWSTYAGGAYFYNTTVGSETDSILSIGWWSGVNAYQNIGAVLQPGTDYVLTMRALVGSSPATGVTLSLQDVSQGWANITNTTINFPDQSQTWRVFHLYVSANSLAGNVGDSLAVSGGLYENPNNQYGWIWIDWLQLAPALPYFTAQPQNQTNYAGASASLTNACIGAVTNSAGPGSVLTYQWYKAPGTLLPNATNATLTIPVLNATNGGNYYVVATGPYGSTTSSNAALVVLPANPPIITTPPVALNGVVNQTVNFSVGVSGTPAFHYQWQLGNTRIPGATNATLTLNNISAASAGNYTVTVTNAFGSASASAALSVYTPVAGSYEAAVLNLQPQVYLRFNDINATNWVFNEGSLGDVADATAEGGSVATTGPLPPSYPNFESTNPAVQFDGADSDVVVPALNNATNTGNTVTMTAWIYCYGPQANYTGVVFERGGGASGLQIQTDNNGNNILDYDWANNNFYTFASGLIIPQYQWCFAALVVTPTSGTLYLQDGTGMLTATNLAPHALNAFTGATHVGWDANGAAAGRRFNGVIDEVTVFNRALSPTEVNTLYSAATGDPAGIVAGPTGLTNYTGQPFQLSVVAAGAPPLAFQWYKNNVAIPGATNVALAVTSATVADSGNYYVHVQNTAGNANSAIATVAIQAAAPIFTVPPGAATIWAGVPYTLTATVNGSAPLNYQWLKNNAVMAGQTNASLTFTDPESGDAANYSLRVTNPAGQTNSPAVWVTVADPAQADQTLFATNTTAAFNLRNNYQPIQGVWFQTGAKNRIVTHLGYFDSTGTGLQTNHWVGIYQGAPGAGALLASVSVPSGTDVPFLNGFRWVALPTPFILLANTNYVLAASDNNWDLWPDVFTPEWNPVYVGNTAGTTRYPMYDSGLNAWPHEPNTPINTWALNGTYGIFNLGAFPFTLSGTGAARQLNWTLGTLQAATSVAGPYTPVPGATSPFTMPATGPAQFYRIQY